jgi:hypothetical protein
LHGGGDAALRILGGAATDLQQFLESVRVQEFKSLYHYIGGQMLTVVTDPNAPHTCAACAFDPRGGILYNNAPFGGTPTLEAAVR